MNSKYWKQTLTRNEALVAYIIIALSLLIGFANPAFYSLQTLFSTIRFVLITIVFALCELVVIISGGIDVSFPAVASFSLYMTISLMNRFHINNAVFAFAFAGAVGLLWGALNGLLIGKFKLPALIATLGTSSLANGAILVYSGGKEISDIPSSIDGLSQVFLLTFTGAHGQRFTLTVFVLLPLALCILFQWFLRHTMLGRSVYAIGGDMVAARVAGINVMRTQFFLYMATGLLVGVAGISNAILLRDANPTNLMGAEMMVIAAVVIGGARITGGHGTVIGTVLGVLLISIVSNNLIMMGVPDYWQTFSIGLIIVIGTSIVSLRAKKISLSPKV